MATEAESRVGGDITGPVEQEPRRDERPEEHEAARPAPAARAPHAHHVYAAAAKSPNATHVATARSQFRRK